MSRFFEEWPLEIKPPDWADPVFRPVPVRRLALRAHARLARARQNPFGQRYTRSMVDAARPTDAALDGIVESLAPFNRRMLLTGAGFSKPWGGYLSAEIWTLVASHPEVRGRVELNRILHDDFNFEVVMARIEGKDRATFTDEDRRILREAVMQAFQFQEKRLAPPGRDLVNDPTLKLIARTFEDLTQKSTTCWFTLNQDLLIERFMFGQEIPVKIPGVISPTAPTARVVFDETDFRFAKGRPTYVKLHGSMNWFEEGGGVAVLGGGKEETIERFDVLRMNSRIFRKATSQSGARLLIIGYGFGDAHINEMIAVGVRSGLALWILDPRPPGAIRKQLEEIGSSTLIWQSVVGHSTCSVDELFAPSTVDHSLFVERFLDR
jgi:hypothetical protein